MPPNEEAFKRAFLAEVQGRLNDVHRDRMLTLELLGPLPPPKWQPPLTRGTAELDVMYEGLTGCDC